MSPLFGHKDQDENGGGAATEDPDIAAMNAEIARVSSLPLAELAAEVMAKGFGLDAPGGPGKPGTIESPSLDADRVTVGTIAGVFTPAYRGRAVGPELELRLTQVLAEGVQALEHASLIRAQWHSNDGAMDYVATRRGREAVERGQVASILGAS